MRTQEQWIKQFDETMPKCKWFIVKYFGEEKYNDLLHLVKIKRIDQAFSEFSNIWFYLPDHIFNIANPEIMKRGWRDFLNLIEPYSNEEYKEITK